jgi:glycosyltransferase A (GT-A) superfamily protein (DUF2064 family)
VSTNIEVVEMAVELLKAMDESTVAKRAAELIEHTLSVIKRTASTSDVTAHPHSFEDSTDDSFIQQNLEQEINYTVRITHCIYLARNYFLTVERSRYSAILVFKISFHQMRFMISARSMKLITQPSIEHSASHCRIWKPLIYGA